MKRALLVAGLVLTIATSVISGTLAAYSQTVDDLQQDTVTAKKFVLDVDKTVSLDEALSKIAPGESRTIEFTVANHKDGNVTETDMDAKIDIQILNRQSSPLKFTLEANDGSSLDTSEAIFSGGDTFTETQRFTAATAKEITYTLTVEWPWGSDSDHDGTTNFDDTGAYLNNDIQYQGVEFGTIKITVAGYQVQPDPFVN